MDERQWIREIQRGRKEYLQDIAEKYYDDIYRFCCYRTGDREASYDLAQETFCRFIRYVENYRYRSLKGYLLTIAMNVCRDFHSALHKRLEHEEEWEDGLEQRPPDGQEGPEGYAVREEQADRLLKLLASLPAMQREAVVLRYIYDLKFRDIARITGVSTATAKSRVNQGMGKLREMTGKEEFYETH